MLWYVWSSTTKAPFVSYSNKQIAYFFIYVILPYLFTVISVLFMKRQISCWKEEIFFSGVRIREINLDKETVSAYVYGGNRKIPCVSTKDKVPESWWSSRIYSHY
jgi:hypothetical protein